MTSASRRSTSCCRKWTASSRAPAWSSWPRPTGRRSSTRRCCGPGASTGRRSIDEEVARLLREAEDTATRLLRGHRETLDRVIGLLLERETIDGSDLAAIVGTPGSADREAAGGPLALPLRGKRQGSEESRRALALGGGHAPGPDPPRGYGIPRSGQVQAAPQSSPSRS